jgi:Flp pilus assembly protein TadD
MGDHMKPHSAGARRLCIGLLGAVLPLMASCNSMQQTFNPDRDPGAVLREYRQRMTEQRVQAEEDADAKSHRSPEQLLGDGDRYRSAGDISGALFSYLSAHELRPERIEPNVRIAYLHLRDDPNRAEMIFDQLVADYPGQADLLIGLALARIGQGKLAAARGVLEQAIELAPESVAAHCSLGVVLDQMGEFVPAQVAYQRAHELRPTDAYILNNLGVSFLFTGEHVMAANAFQRAVHLEPRDPSVHNNHGLALGLLGRYHEALEAFRTHMDEAEAQNNLGYLYYLNGDYEGALEHYELALDVRGESIFRVLHNIEVAQQGLRTIPDDWDEGDSGALGDPAAAEGETGTAGDPAAAVHAEALPLAAEPADDSLEAFLARKVGAPAEEFGAPGGQEVAVPDDGIEATPVADSAGLRELEEAQIAAPPEFAKELSPIVEPVPPLAEDSPGKAPEEVATEDAPVLEPVEIATENAPALEPVEIVTEGAPALEPVEIATENAPALEPVEIVTEGAPILEPVPPLAEDVQPVEAVELAAPGTENGGHSGADAWALEAISEGIEVEVGAQPALEPAPSEPDLAGALATDTEEDTAGTPSAEIPQPPVAGAAIL